MTKEENKKKMQVVSTNHPIIPNTGEHVKYRKIVSIHSEDRNLEKYPSASSFEIELPEDYLNVETVKLVSWCFPSNYDVFSFSNKNLEFTFRFTELQLPIINPLSPDPAYNLALQNVYNVMNANLDHEYVVTIQAGSYSPSQFVLELMNRINQVVTNYVSRLLIDGGFVADEISFNAGGGYNGFTVAFNEVSCKVWFANNNASFVITNTSQFLNETLENVTCYFKQLPDYSNWGLPSFIGFTRADAASQIAMTAEEYRFYYTNYKNPTVGDWVTIDTVNYGTSSTISYLVCPNKINLMGPSHFYVDIDFLNNIDQTSPYNLSRFTRTTNITNGRTNSAFAKIPVPGLPLSMWFDVNVEQNYKFFDPPAERIRKLFIHIKYHNGMYVNFETFNFTMCFEFTLLSPQLALKYNMRK